VSSERARASSASDRVAVAAVLSLSLVPWSIQVYGGGDVTLLFAWGLVNVSPPGVTTLYHFLFVHTMGLPDYILAWPLSVAVYLGALGSAVAGWRRGREDPRVTGGLLVVAGVAQFSVAQGFSLQPNRYAIPLGALAMWAVAWWAYWPRVRRRE
jgi:uncharacterized protein (TIGR04206 family)